MGKKQYMKGSPCRKMGNKPGTLENPFVCVSYKEHYAKLELSTMKGAAVQNNFCNIMYASCCMQHSNIAPCILFMVRLQTKSFARDLLVRHNTQKVWLWKREYMNVRLMLVFMHSSIWRQSGVTFACEHVVCVCVHQWMHVCTWYVCMCASCALMAQFILPSETAKQIEKLSYKFSTTPPHSEHNTWRTSTRLSLLGSVLPFSAHHLYTAT